MAELEERLAGRFEAEIATPRAQQAELEGRLAAQQEEIARLRTERAGGRAAPPGPRHRCGS
jgi:hypothetical protein